MVGRTLVRNVKKLYSGLKSALHDSMTMHKTNNSLLFILVYLLFNINSLIAAEITTAVDRNPVTLDESFQITFTATESPDDDPDFKPLEANFEILNQSHQSSSSWVNGRSTKSIQWVLNVMAKQTGKLLIPAISFGDDLSQMKSITVNQGSISTRNSNDEELFLEVEATPENPYVQSQIIYTVRFFQRVQLAQASVNEPVMTDALIEKLGKEKQYTTELNGVAYKVTELKYAIFPQKSGVFVINPLTLTAQVVSRQRPRFNGFFSNQMTKTKRISSESITIDVQAAPDNFNNKQWLPAEHVYVEEKWSGDTENMKIGEPLTRTLTILAKGITAAQLPELSSESNIVNLKSYPDQAELKEQNNEDGVIALREQKIAYIPSSSGNFTLPAIEVPWFNTETQTMEIARIPEKTVTAIGLAATVIQPGNTQPIITDTSSPATVGTVKQVVGNQFWMWLSLFLVLGWIATIIFFLRNKQEKPVIKASDNGEMQLKESIKILKKACAKNDPLAAKNALLGWGKIKFNSTNLSTTASHCEARLRDEIYQLNQQLYSNEQQQWQGKKLFQYFTENKAREKVTQSVDDALEPLYKL